MTVERAAIDVAEAAALARDAADPSFGWQERFLRPVAADGQPKAYLAGQSLGLQPVTARAAVLAQLDAWGRLAVDGHFDPAAWADLDERVSETTARLVGAAPHEIATLNTLTVNLHVLLASVYRPRGGRQAILMDAPTFPSDRYVVDSVLRGHGLDPVRDLIVVEPPAGSATLPPETIEASIHAHRDRLALVLLAGVNYATGQAHDIARLTRATHEAGAIAMWELAHAVGNIPVDLRAADVDVAAWCTYKYLNAGPGALGQIFVAERLAADPTVPRLAGWWGNEAATRFEMAPTFRPERDANGWRMSNPPILSLAPIEPALAMIDAVGMPALRAKSMALTGYLEALVDALVPDAEILTPRDPEARGAQLSIRLPDARRRQHALEAHDVVADFREPDIVRLAPVPLYNGYHDAWRAATALAATAG